MSGKSTLVKQVALHVVLAQSGCYVPATSASFRLTDRIFSRLGTSDNIEENASTFMVEMLDISFIMAHLTEKSLVIVDELGRGTSISDGRALSWAISEKLAMSGAFTFFVTHFHELLALTQHYPVKVHHLLVADQPDAHDNERKLEYKYLLCAGVSAVKGYGIELARSVGFPPSVVEEAEKLLCTQQELRKKELNSPEVALNRLMREVTLDVVSLNQCTVSATALCTLLRDLRERAKAAIQAVSL